MTTFTLPAAALSAALRSVRFAVGTDPQIPVLGGVLLDVTADALTVVATDRYRLAVSTVPGGGAPAVTAVVPAAFADRLATFTTGEVELRIDGPAVSARCGAAEVADRLLDDAFPDYRRLLPAAGSNPVPVDAAELRTAVAAAGTRQVRREQDGVDVDVTVLSVDGDGRLQVGTGPEGIGVSVEFLLEAADAGGTGQLLLELDGPLAPVTIRAADRPDTFSLLMPVRL